MKLQLMNSIFKQMKLLIAIYLHCLIILLNLIYLIQIIFLKSNLFMPNQPHEE